jgi:hypothetical protein
MKIWRSGFVAVAPNTAVKRDCGLGAGGFINRRRAAAPNLQR